MALTDMVIRRNTLAFRLALLLPTRFCWIEAARVGNNYQDFVLMKFGYFPE